MNRPASSKFVPGLPADDDIDTPTNAPVDDSIKIYDGVADCTMNDADTLKSVKLRAKDLAIQKVKQKIADYVYGFWKDRYLTLPDDEVLSIANEICTITDVKYNMQDSDGDKMIIRATVLAQVDDNILMNYIIQFFKERNELKIQNEALRKEIEDLKRQRDTVVREKSALESSNRELQRKIEEFKRQNTNSQQSTPQTTVKDRIALAKQKYDKARELYSKNRYADSIKFYDEAIQLNPTDIMYNSRGLAYYHLNQYERAIQDFNIAIKLDTNFEAAYYNRGKCYQAISEYAKSQADFKKSEEISNRNSWLKR